MSVHHYPDTWQLDIAGNVRAEVARKRLTQSDIAGVLAENQQWVHRRMSGNVEWRISELVAIADLLGIHPAVLLGGRPPTDWDGSPDAQPSNPVTREYLASISTLKPKPPTTADLSAAA
jgi:hypothetical protein